MTYTEEVDEDGILLKTSAGYKWQMLDAKVIND